MTKMQKFKEGTKRAVVPLAKTVLFGCAVGLVIGAVRVGQSRVGG